jgi:ribosomal protein S18 acetylase RimI-like enzyme
MNSNRETPPVSMRTGTSQDVFLVAASLQRSIVRPSRHLISQFVKENIHEAVIACLPDDPDVVLGFLLASPGRGAVHFCFVKPAFRRFGIARMMWDEAFKVPPQFYTLCLHSRPTSLIERLGLKYEPLAMMVKGFS